jgi:hypothetical protein
MKLGVYKQKVEGLEYKFEGLSGKVDALNAKDEIIKYLLEQWERRLKKEGKSKL